MATKQKQSTAAESTAAAPSREDGADGGGTSTGWGQSLWGSLPSGTTLLYVGSLGLAGAFCVIAWPVVAAIGVGTAVAQRAASAGASASRRSGGSSAQESK